MKIPSPYPAQFYKTLKSMGCDEDRVFLRADKSNTMVVLDKDTYHLKLSEMLSNGSDYAFIDSGMENDPSQKFCKLLDKKLKSVFWQGLPAKTLKEINPRRFQEYGVCLRTHGRSSPFYGLPKLHKLPGIPETAQDLEVALEQLKFRPIAPAYNTPDYDLCKHLTSILNPLKRSEFSIKNATDFLERLNNVQISDQTIVFSLDVVSLFTCVPVDLACQHINEALEKDENLHLRTSLSPSEICDLLSFCFKNTFLIVGEEFYQQKTGCAMGKPPSPVVADLFMGVLETKAIAEYHLKPTMCVRYVDDYFVVWPHGEETVASFLQHMNSQHPVIKFTIEFEHNRKLPFLDVLVQRNTDSFCTSVYRKPSNSNLFIPFQSFHHPAHKNAAICSLTYRAFTHCSDESLRSKELNKIFRTFMANGYPSSTVTSVMAKCKQRFESKSTNPADISVNQLAITYGEEKRISVSVPYVGALFHVLQRRAKKYHITIIPKTQTSIRSAISHPKTPIPEEQRSGVVYGIGCSCKQIYVGQTDREVATRLSEHRQQWGLRKGAFIDHPSPQHNPDFGGFCILSCENSTEIREVKEALLIAQAGKSCIFNQNLGMRSSVNRNRGRNLNENYSILIARFPPLGLLKTPSEAETECDIRN